MNKTNYEPYQRVEPHQFQAERDEILKNIKAEARGFASNEITAFFGNAQSSSDLLSVIIIGSN